MPVARGLALALAAAVAATGRAQWIPSSFRGYSSSFVSSSSWLPGRDGQLHQRVHEVRTETVRSGAGVQKTQSEVACKDGLCQGRKTVSIAQPGSVTVMHQQGPGAAPTGGLSARLQAVIQALSRSHAPLQGAAPHFLAPRAMPVQVLAPRPAPESKPSLDVNLLVPLAAFSGATAALLSLIVAAILKCRTSEAREPALRDLGEPLAAGTPQPCSWGAGRVVPVPPAAKSTTTTSEEVPVISSAAYLNRVYERAVVATEAAAARAYVTRVLARAAA